MTAAPRADPAERAVLGAVLESPRALANVRRTLDAGDFYKPAHQAIYTAAVAVADSGHHVDPVAVADELERRGELSRTGGHPYLVELVQAAAPTPDAAAHDAGIVRRKAEHRRALETVHRGVQRLETEDVDPADALDRIRGELDQITTAAAPADEQARELSDRFVSGAAFILDAPTEVPAVWGTGNDVLWSDGEALMIAAGNGLGKTTLAVQLVRARLGLDGKVLDLPVQPGARRVLYLAMDRPHQIRRAMGRAFAEHERGVLAEQLVFWPGPPTHDMALHPGVLTRMCEEADADTVVVDSLKDAAVGLSADETAAAYNRARQAALANGVQVVELHHTRKQNATGGEPDSITDVYGSTWLTTGAGSVVLLTGNPGDPVVGLRHVKQPMNEIGPWTLLHDHDHGTTTVQHGADPFALLHAQGQNGATAKDFARLLFAAEAPKQAQVEKARRKLERLVSAGMAKCVSGDRATSTPARYIAVGTAP